ncbi:hypothetical protein GEV33_014789 [Tenebrio molitor]|uniref:C2H2-type domain-containing protein n=1 Tax=Tenebrio molitor TaxID=7067 RepID=A0A8J6H508_TENMO|nr:hypothetical protein GEV33_014789 [Tenebrio molitor]
MHMKIVHKLTNVQLGNYNDLTSVPRVESAIGTKNHLTNTLSGFVAKNLSFGVTGALALSNRKGKRPYKCPSCDNCYKYKRSLDKHVKWICGKEPQFRCDYCDRPFKQKYHCKSHMRMVHKLGSAEVLTLEFVD